MKKLALLLLVSGCEIFNSFSASAQSHDSSVLQGSVRFSTNEPFQEITAPQGQSTSTNISLLKESDVATAKIPNAGPVKALDPVLWPGNYFDKDVAAALLGDRSINRSIWKKVPEWQVGSWQSTQSTNTRRLQYFNGKPSSYATPMGVYTAKGGGSIGWQKDKNGDVWDHFKSGYWTEAEFDTIYEYTFVKFRIPGAYEYPDEYAESITFGVDKGSKKITSVQRCRTWARYVNVAPGIMKKDQVDTIYNQKGNPDCSAWNTCVLKRVQTFSDNEAKLNQDEDLRLDFVKYLTANGLQDLIPTH